MNKEVELVADRVLRCPGCGEETTTHHGTVRIYFRQHEDDPTTILTTVQHEHEFSREIIPSKINPSSRRDAIGIMFSCECCSARYELCIIQHKGQTVFEWRQA